MKRYWTFWCVLLVIGLTAGLALAADAQPPADKPAPPAGHKIGDQPPPPPPPLPQQIEAKLGKPLTDDQQTQIKDAEETRKAAVGTARDALVQTLTQITGLDADKVKALLPPPGPPPPPPPPQGDNQGSLPPPPPQGDSQGNPPPHHGHQPPPPQGDNQGNPPPPPPNGQQPPAAGQSGQGPHGQGPRGHMPPPLDGGPGLIPALEKTLGSKLTEDQVTQIRAAQQVFRDAMKTAHEAFVQKLATITGLTADDIQAMLPKPPPPPPAGQGPHGPPPQTNGDQQGPAHQGAPHQGPAR